jgi:poly-gamma-glutamate synthesis protein (capsule biosynthesis protein)
VFGIPAQIVTDLADQGWDGCSTASNHTLDRGVAGVTATLDTFDVAHLGHVGSGRTEAEANSPQIYQIVRKDRTITIAHIAMAYGTNGIPIPASAPWAVNIIDTDWAIGQAVAARQAGADMVVVSMHDGVEYQATPTQEQLSSAQALAESGQVDLVIGHHVHVPQPIVKLDGGPRGEGMWVAYGLGNFLSNQSSACCAAATSNGILMTATVIAQPGQPPQVTGVTWTATTVDIKAGHRIRVISDAINEPGAGTLSVAQLQARRDLVAGVVGDVAPERTSPPTPAPGVTVTVVPRETPQ